MRSEGAMIKIYPAYPDGSFVTIAYQARGHHDAAAFVAALEEQYGLTCDPQHVVHECLRVVPCGEGGGLVQIEAEPGTRGAFSVTEVEAHYVRPVLRVVES